MAKVYAARTVMQEIEETRRIAAGEVGLNTLWVPSGTKANLAPQHRMGGLRMSMSRKQFKTVRMPPNGSPIDFRLPREVSVPSLHPLDRWLPSSRCLPLPSPSCG